MVWQARSQLLAGLILGIGLVSSCPYTATAVPAATFQVAQYDPDSEEAFQQRIAPAIREGYRQMYGDPVDREAERRRQQQEQNQVIGVGIIVGLALLGAMFKGRG